jgi:hypothetical protein
MAKELHIAKENIINDHQSQLRYISYTNLLGQWRYKQRGHLLHLILN